MVAVGEDYCLTERRAEPLDKKRGSKCQMIHIQNDNGVQSAGGKKTGKTHGTEHGVNAATLCVRRLIWRYTHAHQWQPMNANNDAYGCRVCGAWRGEQLWS